MNGSRRIQVGDAGVSVPWITLAELWHEAAATRPDEVAAIFLDEGLSLTNAGLWARADALGRRFCELGVSAGDRIGTLMPNSVQHVVTWVACSRIGAVFVPLNTALEADDLAPVIADANATLMVIAAEHEVRYRSAASSVGAEATCVITDSLVPEVNVAGSEMVARDDYHRGDPSDIAAIVFTGGTTGRAKGVMRSHFSFICGATRYNEIFKPTKADRHLVNGPLFHGGAQEGGLLGPLISGIPSVWRRAFSARRFMEDARKSASTITSFSGAHIVFLLRQPAHSSDRDNKLRAAIGAVHGLRSDLREEFSERFGIKLLDIYAMTETGMMLVHNTVADSKTGSVGRPRGWCEIRISDESGLEVPVGTVGEILLRPALPAMMTRGYLGQERVTLELYRDCWLHTGDFGSVDEDGWLQLEGRRADRIRCRGENASAHEIEALIEGHPAVVEAGVVAVPSELGDDDIKAVVVPVPGAALVAADVAEWCQERVAPFKVPRYVYVTSEPLPRTGGKGEIDRARVRAAGGDAVWDRGERRRPASGGAAQASAGTSRGRVT